MTLLEYQRINLKRAVKWHKGDINSWSLSDWACAMVGEAGEICNVVKKLRRAEDGLIGNTKTDAELKQDLADEIADTFTYLLCLASAANIDLETSFVKKFNEVSDKQGFGGEYKIIRSAPSQSIPANDNTKPAISSADLLKNLDTPEIKGAIGPATRHS